MKLIREIFLSLEDKIYSSSIGLEIAKNKNEVVIIDLNNNKDVEALCDTVLYLVEPSIIKLNKLMLTNPRIFQDLGDKKVVLSKSMLSENDVSDFEKEAHVKVYFNMPPINDRDKEQNAVNKLLVSLGFSRQTYSEY